MSPRSRNSDQEAMGRYWDALVQGAAAEELERLAQPLDPAVVTLLAQWHALRQMRAPEAAFRHHLEQDLMHAFALAQPGTIPLRPPLPYPRNGRTALPGQGRLPPAPPLPRRPSWAWAQAAAAVLLVVAIVGAYFSFFHHDDHAVVPGIATPSPEATPAADWPMYRANPARSGTTSGSGPDGQPVTAWTYHAAGSAARSPAVAGGVAYLQTGDGMVTALEARTGQVLWQNGTTGTVENTPAVANNRLFLLTASRELAALDTVTGAEQWRFGNGLAPECMPVVLDGVVYVGSDDGTVYAIDAGTGEERWQRTISGPVWRSLAIGGGMIFAGTSNGHLDALDLATGEARWQFAGDDDTQTIGTPTFADGVVYVNYNGSLFALDAATGTQRWTKHFAGSRLPTVAKGMLFSGGLDGTVYAIDAATGDDRWTFATEDEIQAAPAFVDNALFVASFDQRLYALDAATGRERWSVDLDGAVVFGPSIAGNMIYVGTDAGTLYALGGSGTAQLPAPQEAPPFANADLSDATPLADSPETSSSANGIVNGEGPAIGRVSFVMSIADPEHPIRHAGGVAVAPDGTIYVVDILNNQVHAFDPDGTPRTIWGRRGDGPGAFQFNQGDYGFGDVKVGPDGAVYVLERQGSRVQKFTPDGAFIASWGERGSDPGQFNDPNTLAITPEGEILVADTGNARIQVFDQDGNVLRVWGEPGTMPGKLQAPWKAIARPNGTILVADVGLQVFAFDQDGLFLGTAVAGDSASSNPDSTYGLDIDAAGNIYLDDFVNNRIAILAPDLTLLAAWGGEGTGDGEFQGANDIALDQQGRIYVADEQNNRVQVFQLAPP